MAQLFPWFVAERYDEFYQLLYGPGCAFRPPVGLLEYASHIPITSLAQLETLFALYNTALGRNPLLDRQVRQRP